MAKYRIAQVNIGRVRAQLDDPIMAGFVTRLDELNALADDSPGFVWRLQTPEATLPTCGPTTMIASSSTCRSGRPWKTSNTMFIELLTRSYSGSATSGSKR